MRSQEELLQGTDIPSDDLPNHVFTKADEDFLAVAEGFVFYEWERASKVITGLSARAENIPENYDAALQRQGKWDLNYASPEQM